MISSAILCIKYVDDIFGVGTCEHVYKNFHFLLKLLEKLDFITATYDIQLTILHIPGKESTIANLLSRWEGNHYSQKQLSQSVTQYGILLTIPYEYTDIVLIIYV